jgi:perosamine synthetase
LQQITPNSRHAWHQYCVLVDPQAFGCDRDTLAQRLQEKGIATAVHYPRGLHQQPIFQELYGTIRLPHAEYLAEHILALPVHHSLSTDDVSIIVESVRAGCG